MTRPLPPSLEQARVVKVEGTKSDREFFAEFVGLVCPVVQTETRGTKARPGTWLLLDGGDLGLAWFRLGKEVEIVDA